MPAIFLATGSVELPLTLFLTFVAAKLLGELFERLRLPATVGEILAGILLGPSLLGWVKPNETLELLSELGVMFLLFRVGLEVDPKQMLQVGRSAVQVAVIGVVLPFACGFGIWAWRGNTQIEAIFVGAALVATSVGITAQVLAGKGLMETLASKTILAAAVIDDILGLLVLALASSMAKGSVDYLQIGITAVLAIGFTMFMATLGSRAVTNIFPKLDGNLRAAEWRFNACLAVLFGLALLASYAGVAAIIGAFLAGMALSQSVGQREHDLTNGIAEFTVPFFLALLGLKIDLHAMKEPDLILWGGVLVVVAALTKVMAGWGATGVSAKDKLRIGVGMIPRGEVGMVVAQLGLTLGVVSLKTYNVVVLIAVATTVIAPPLLSIVFRGMGSKPQDRFQIG
jgi:Kef-type K+ transport system membrane component KefB